LAQIDKLNPEFVRGAINGLIIKDGYKDLADSALERSKEILRAV
jgi:hypothetical protein